MELIVLLMIVAVGGFWYLNHQMRKSAERRAAESAPYKVEPPAEPMVPAQPVEIVKEEVAAAPAVEAKRVKKPAKSKAVVTKPAKKPRAAKATKKVKA